MDAAMGAMGLGIILTLRDQASNGLDKIRAKMSGLQGVTQKMVKDFDANAKKLMAGIGMMWTGSKVFNSFNNLLGSSIQVAANFEQAMAGVAAVSGAAGADFEKLSAQAKQLGRDTQFSASQAANAQELLARAGFYTNEIIAAMPSVLNMAAAEGMGLADAADIASGVLRGFGLQATESDRVANVLAATSSKTATSIKTLSDSFTYAAPHAKALGIQLEDATAMIGVMGDASIKGSMAGTAMASALRRLATQPKQAAKALASIGLSANDALVNGSVSLEKLMKLIDSKTKDLDKLQKENILSKIFGGEASAGMLAVMDAAVSGKLAQKRSEIAGASNAGQEMADRMNATYEGATKRLESASEGLQIAIGNIFIPVKTWLIDKYANIKSAITGFIENFPILSKAVFGGAGAIMTLVGSVLTLNGALMAAQSASKIWKLAMKASGSSVTKFFGAPLLKAFGDVRILFQDARSWGWGLSKSLGYAFAPLKQDVGNSIKGMLKALWSIPGPIKLIIAALGLMTAAYKTNFAGFRDMITAISTGWKFALAASKDGILEVDEATAQQLEKAGLWDAVQNMGKVFFRVLEFFRGFKDGVVEALTFVSNAFAKLGDVFKPFITGGTACLNFLGILSPVVETQASAWRTVGKWVGYAVTSIYGLSKVIKIISLFKRVTVLSTIASKAWAAAQWVGNLALKAGKGLWNIGKLALYATKTIAVTVATKAWTAAQWLWHAAMKAGSALLSVGKIVLYATKTALVTAATKAWTAAQWAWGLAMKAGSALLSVSKIVLYAAKTAVVTTATKAWTAAQWLWSAAMKAKDSLLNVAQLVLYHAKSIAIQAATKAWTAAQWLWNAAMNANPIGLIIIGITGLIAAGYALYKNWDKVKAHLIAAWNAVRGAVRSFWEWLKGLSLWDAIVSTWNAVKIKVQQGWQNLKSWLAGFIPDWIKNPWNSLVTWFDEVAASIKQKWENFKQDLLNLLPDWLKSLMGIQTEAANAMANIDVNSPDFKASSGSVFDIKVDWAALESGWETTKTKLANGWGVVWDGLTNGASGAWKLIEDGWENTCKWMGDVGDSVWNGITKAWDWIWGNSEKSEQQTVQAQTKDLTILNKMYEGFEAKVQEMTNAWNPFKKSLGEGFENIFNIMKRVGDNIRTHVITAVMELKSALDLLQVGIQNLSRIGNINLNIPTSQVQESQRAMGAAANIDKSFKFHALGGIFTQPHIGLVAESGPEAIIPLSDPSRGMPLLNKAAEILGMRNFAMPNFKENASAGILASLSRNNQNESVNEPQAARREQEDAQVNNNMNVRMEAVTTPVYLDGDLIGEFITRFFEHQDMRNGSPALA